MSKVAPSRILIVNDEIDLGTALCRVDQQGLRK
jgi:hypothetical protein